MKTLLIGLLFAFTTVIAPLSYSSISYADSQGGDVKVKTQAMLTSATTTGAGSGFQFFQLPKTFQAYGTTSAGAGAATIKIQVSDVASPGTNDWIDLGTITLVLGTTNTGDGFATAVRWRWYRANITAISGTTATVSVIAGY